jgi:colanic acid/amylovoran biosynthesis glycosyltransferase
MDNIIIFRKRFYKVSETFIRTQVEYLKKFFAVVLVAEEFINEGKENYSDIQKITLNKYEKKIRRLYSKFRGTEVEPRFQFHNQFQLRKLIKKKNIRLIHAHFGPDALKVLPVAKKHKVPLVVSFHGYDASSLLSNGWYKLQLPKLFDYASKIIIVSTHMMENLNLQSWKDKVVLLPYSIDVEKFKPYKKTNNSKIILLHSGRLVNKKGVPDLIEVFAKIYKTNKNLHLNIIGSGPEFECCKTTAYNHGVTEAISFMGSQPHESVKKIMNEADIFILNSRTADDGEMEGTPVSLLEAMSIEKAVISTNHAGIPDVIQNNENGMLVPERDNEKLELAIRDLIENEEKRSKLGKQARQTIISRFSNHTNLPVLRDTLFSVT